MCIKPNHLRAKVNLSRGDLELVPAVLSPNMTNTRSTGGALPVATKLVVKGEPVVLYISRQSQPRVEMSKWEEKDTYNPFWWVGDVSDAKSANMVIVREKEGDYKIPVLRNKRAIQKGSVINMFKAVESTQKLAGATVIDDVDDEEG